MIPRVTIGVILLSFVMSGFSRTGQDQLPRPTFRTEANYIRVDVYPTKDGAPVTELAKDDFEILDEHAPQKIEQFEHVTVRGNLPQEMRREPNTVAESRAAIQNPRARVFVVFLDVGHVDVAGSQRIRQPLIDTLNRLIGEDDLVALMTPEMSALDLTFARKTTTIEGLLTRNWYWGERDQLIPDDPAEKNYETCFGLKGQSRLTDELIARRREKQTLDALEDLVRYLRGAREERKAVIVITDGWVLYGPNDTLINSRVDSVPGVVLNPGTGRLQAGDAHLPGSMPQDQCQRDLMFLAHLDDATAFRRFLNEANYANTAFYPLDPRGLAVFDSPINQPLPLNADAAALRTRAESLRTLAENTDGLAMLNSNDLGSSFRKIVADLSSYYLLGYYSTTKLDGRFHSITVRVKRPGVQVRARRGYEAAPASAANAATATAAASAMPAKADAEMAAVTAAIAPLAGYVRDVPLRVQAAVGWKPGEPPASFVHIEGELSGAREFEDLWKGGAVATIELATATGSSVASARATVAAGGRTFRVALTPGQPLAPGDYIVRISVRSTDATIPTRDTLHVTVPPSPQAAGAIWLRRGQATGNREVPTADLRFRRNEQATVEIPTLATEAGAARLLDRAGKALSIPVATAIRGDADGPRWVTAQLALAPLAVGDYVIEIAEGGNRMLAAFRVIP